MAERKRKPRIGPLSTLGGLVDEMTKVYRQARRSEIRVERASKLVYMLSQMRSALEVAQLEARVAALEALK